MEYVQLKADPLRIARGPGALPKSFRSISGFDRLTREELATHGWFPWRAEVPPPVDHRIERLTIEVVLGDDGVAYPRYTRSPCSAAEQSHALAEARRRRLQKLAAKRYQQESLGVEFEGIPLGTDREATAALQLAALGGVPERWKGLNGHWYAMSEAQLRQAAEAVVAYRRACFAHEEVLADALRQAHDLATLDGIELEQGWPSTSV